MPTNESTNTHFARANALVDFGWMKILKPVELVVLCILERHAKTDGTNPQPPFIKTLAEKAYEGKSTRNREYHIKVAMKALEAYGLIRFIGDSDHQVEMLLPSPSPGGSSDADESGEAIAEALEIGAPAALETRAQGALEKEARSDSVTFALENDDKITPISSAHNKDEQNTEHHNEQLFQAAPGDTPAAAAANGKRSQDAAEKERRGKVHQAAIAVWCELWKSSHRGIECHFDHGRDAKMIQRLLQRAGIGYDLEKFTAAARIYLAITEHFIVQKSHPLTLFFDRIDKIREIMAQPEGEQNGTYCGIAEKIGGTAARRQLREIN